MKNWTFLIIITLVLFSTFINVEAVTNDSNNTSNQAISIESGIPIYEKIDSGEDVDWYKIHVLKAGNVRITLENLPFEYRFTLYDEDNNSLENLAKEQDYSTNAVMREYEISDVGIYYIKVESDGAYSSTKEYRLKATYPSESPAHNNEYEPNDTKENGYGVVSGKVYEAKLDSPYDQDVYVLPVKKPGEIRIWLDNLPFNYKVDLYNEDWIKLNDNFYRQKSNFIEYSTLEAGTFYAVVHSPQNEYSEKTAYLFKATYPSAVKYDKTYEPNDTKETGYTLLSGKTYNGKIEYGNDVDVYKLAVSKPGHVRVNLDALPFSYSMDLYDDKGNRISYGLSRGKTSKYIDYSVKEAGSYYIYIKSFSNESSKTKGYRLKASFPTKKVTHQKKTLESNDTRETAYPMSSGKTYKEVISSPTDEDYFKITLKKGERISVKLSNLIYNYKLSIVDGRGKSVKDKSTWDLKPIEALYKAPASGTHFIRISTSQDDYSDSKPYSLSVLKSKYYRPIINEINSNSTFISGEAEPNMKVYVKAGSKVIASKKNSSSGYYLISIPKQKERTKITVYTKDSKGTSSPMATTIVK